MPPAHRQVSVDKGEACPDVFGTEGLCGELQPPAIFLAPWQTIQGAGAGTGRIAVRFSVEIGQPLAQVAPEDLDLQRPRADRIGRHVEHVAVRAERVEHPPRVLKSLVLARAAGPGACPDSFKVEARAVTFDEEVRMAGR